MNYTKGEWKVTELTQRAAVISDIIKPFMPIADCGFIEVPENQANAHLIAAAPNLLQALINARVQILYLHDKFAVTGSDNQVLASIDMALAKAEGKEGGS